MERNKEDLTQEPQRWRKSQDGSLPSDTAGESFSKLRRPLAIDTPRRHAHVAIWWLLGSLGVTAIAILAWLAGSSGARSGVSVGASETIRASEAVLSADLQASVSAAENLRQNLVTMTELVATLEARLATTNTLPDSAATSASVAAGDSDIVTGSQQEHSAGATPGKEGRKNPVAAVQFHLVNLGYDPGPADGSWGEQTCKALKAYQRDKGVPVGCGAEHRSVAELQARLVDLGYDPGAIDGSWGKTTCKALQLYQRAKGLRVSCGERNRTVAALGIQ